jgi:hypothetical protein
MSNTAYNNIKHLQPNHYLDLQKIKSIRFWPNKQLTTIPLKQGVEIGSKLLTGTIESANNRYELTLPVTAGNDSRLLLAATKNIKEEVFYYIIKHQSYTQQHHDIKIPRKLFSKIGVPFNVIEYSNDVDEEFKKQYYLNCEFATDNDLALIYNVFYKKLPNKINLPGRLGSISRNFYTTYRKNISPEILAKMYKYGNSEYAINIYSNWLNEISDLASNYGYNILSLFDLEENNGNFHTQFQSYKDIAQEEFAPMNNRLLLNTFLSVPIKYRNIYTNYFFKEMIKYMWPELLSVPINPHLNKYYFATKLKLYWFFRMIKKGY